MEEIFVNEIKSDDESDGNENLLGMWLEGDSLAPPCQAELDVVKSIVQFAHLTENSVLFDLGCGDGRICLWAAMKYSCRAVGCEIESSLITKFHHFIEILNLKDRVTAVHGDLVELDLSEATVIIVYLLPESIVLITEKLIKCLRRGAVVICNTWGPKSLTPVDKIQCGPFNGVNLYKYDVSSLPPSL